MRKRRAEVAQEAPLLPLPAPPLDSDGDRSDDSIDSTSLFGPWSSSDDEQRGSKLPKDEWSDEDLDISLATLTHEAVHDGKKPKKQLQAMKIGIGFLNSTVLVMTSSSPMAVCPFSMLAKRATR